MTKTEDNEAKERETELAALRAENKRLHKQILALLEAETEGVKELILLICSWSEARLNKYGKDAKEKDNG